MTTRRPLIAARTIAVAATCGWLAACGGDTTDHATPAAAEGTFARIQRTIIEPQCVSCHRAGTSDARTSQLVLSRDSAYVQMVGVASAQTVARADGMQRVKPFRADSSLLYHKLAWVPGHHSRDYGTLMPMGVTQGLTSGQLEYVRRWIEAGAPRDGIVVDTAVLADARLQTANFTPLAAPGAGAGLQLKVDSFAVAPTMERELFLYRPVGNTSDLYVTRIESRMRPGSHHLLLYTFDEARTTFPCNTRPAPNTVRDIASRSATGMYT